MPQPDTTHLYDKQSSVVFYDERYANGWMDEWPIEKKRRLAELLQGFGLPAQGEALDFGCGNGVFTDVIREALPGWKVYGMDISANAIANARERYPKCTFFVASDPELAGRRFDFVHTHHVLEHVYNLAQVLDDVNSRLKDRVNVLHILPCGNAGSLEDQICRLRTDGINPQAENRCFFEDHGHLRRMTTAQMIQLCQAYDLHLVQQHYSNQYHGAVDWITMSRPGFVQMLTGTETAVDDAARAKLRALRRKLLLLRNLRLAAMVVEDKLRKRRRTLRDYLILLLALPLYPLAKPVDLQIKAKHADEWEHHRAEPNGSEMYLFFQRPGKA